MGDIHVWKTTAEWVSEYIFVTATIVDNNVLVGMGILPMSALG